MRSWDLRTVGVEPHQPQILASADDARTILLQLPAGEELQEHEVHERARIVVIDGQVEVAPASGEGVSAGPGHLLGVRTGRAPHGRGPIRCAPVADPVPAGGWPFPGR